MRVHWPTSTSARAGLSLGIAAAVALVVVVLTGGGGTDEPTLAATTDETVLGNVIEPSDESSSTSEKAPTTTERATTTTERTTTTQAPAATTEPPTVAPATTTPPTAPPTVPPTTAPVTTTAPTVTTEPFIPPPGPTVTTTTAAPTTTTTTTPPPTTGTVNVRVDGHRDFDSITVSLDGPRSESVDVPPTGGRVTFEDVPAGGYELFLEYVQEEPAEDPDDPPASSSVIDRSTGFQLEGGDTLSATWSRDGGWILVL